MKRFLFAGALALAASAQVRAADLPQPPPPPPPQMPAAYIPATAPVYNWGGIYFGVNGGYGFGTTSWTTTGAGASGDFDLSGFLVGSTLGVNVQADAFVFGIEGDLDYSWITSGSNTNALCVFACETKNTWLATVRARLGYAADRVLVYGTAGGAFANVQAGVIPYSSLSDTIEPGWTAGGGIEAAFAENWTARVEYLFVDLENSTCSGGNCGPNPPSTTVKFDANVVRIGLDYKFR